MNHRRTISIHAPRVGSDKSVQEIFYPAMYFNPRSPCGERRDLSHAADAQQSFQSTLPVWGATLLPFGRNPTRDVSIHAPRVGSDFGMDDLFDRYEVSIHAPRVGSDFSRRRRKRSVHSFNPRSPCGERPNHLSSCTTIGRFQSTLPVWGATETGGKEAQEQYVSIHAPRVGSDGHIHSLSLSVKSVSIHAPRVGSDLLRFRY